MFAEGRRGTHKDAIIPVAGDQGIIGRHGREGNQEFGLGAGFQAIVKLDAILDDFFNHVALLTHLFVFGFGIKIK